MGEASVRKAVALPNGAVACLECQSEHVRPSGSAYPMDKDKNPDGRASFWRCSHCGARFMGPFVPASKHRRHRSHSRDSLGESLTLARLLKRWAFPLIVILVTVVAVAVILDRRNRDVRPQIIAAPPR